jgi:hypothetical protein
MYFIDDLKLLKYLSGFKELEKKLFNAICTKIMSTRQIFKLRGWKS